MMRTTLASLAFAAGCLTAVAAVPAAQAQMQPQTGDELVTNGPQASGGDGSGGWSARQNVIQSQHYDRLVETSPGFRQARMRKECGPITDPQLHASCLASFSQGEPMAGSSSPPHRYRYNSNAGR
jgi:hypothetical protein